MTNEKRLQGILKETQVAKEQEERKAEQSRERFRMMIAIGNKEEAQKAELEAIAQAKFIQSLNNPE